MEKQLTKFNNRIIKLLLVCIVNFGLALPGFAQTKTVSGVVTDASTGELIIGASVVVTGTQRGTATNVGGRFTLEAAPTETLTVSYLGYVSQKLSVGNQTTFTVHLEESAEILDEVIVTGYASQRKSTLTGSISTIGNKDIKVTKNENVLNMLAGKMPGLRISQKNASPGAYATVIDIRGYGTPLFVIDGVPRDQEFFSRMDPEEIDNISILKDAAAAVYGLRAANGVILITTKSGTAQNGKVDISYTGNYTMQQFIYVPKGVSAYDWLTLRNEQHWQNFGSNYLNRQPALHPESEMAEWRDGTKQDYDWMSAIFRDITPQTQHNVGINGGTESLRYFVSLGYSRQDGSYKSGSLWSERWNVRSNIDAQITKRLKAKVQIGAILSNNHRPEHSDWSVYKNVWLQRPDAPFYANDNPLYLNGDFTVVNDVNSLAQTNSDITGYALEKTRRINGSLGLTYDIPGIKGLAAQASFDYGMQLPDNTYYRKAYNVYKYNKNEEIYTAAAQRNPSQTTRWAAFNTDTDLKLGLTYSNKFDKHNVNATVVFEEVYNTWDNFQAQREILVNSEYLFAGEDLYQSATGGTPGDRLNQAFIGQFNYDFGGKYLADFRFRYDGSSRFPKGSRWGFFPSLSLGWRLSEESFLKNNFDFLTNLKLRASYGELGDDSPAKNYPPDVVGYNLDRNNRGWYFNGTLAGGVSPTDIPNPNLTWLKVKMLNIALDFDFFQQKLSGTFELFRRDRSGLLETSSSVIPGTVGASLPQENLNSDQNFGWEIELAHRNRVNKIEYFVSGQFSAARSMRTDWLETPANNSYDKWRNRTSGRYDNIWWEREAGGIFTNMNDIRNYQQYPMGQGATPGDWWVVDWNEDGTIDINDDHPVATRGLPFFNFGTSIGGSYKNFDLTVNFQGSYKVYVSYAEVFTEALPFGGRNTLYWFMDRWRPENPNADYFNPNTVWISGYYPVTGHDGRRTGTNNMQDASYIRLKTLELGYTLPKKILSKTGIKNLRVYLSGYNLLTLCGLKDIDPERPGSTSGVGTSTNYIDFYQYPNNRTYTIGASIKF